MMESILIWIFYASFCAFITAVNKRIKSEDMNGLMQHFWTWQLLPIWFPIMLIISLCKKQSSNFIDWMLRELFEKPKTNNNNQLKTKK